MFGEKDIYFDIRINDFEKIYSYRDEIDFSKLTNDLETYLHYAVKCNAYDCARFFIKYIDPNCKNINGESPLFYATKMGKLEMIKLLIRNGADINLRNNLGEIALMPAIIKGNLDCVKLLIESKSKVDILNNDSKIIAHYAIIGGYNIFTYLHKKNYFDINYRDDMNNTLLHYACKTSNIKLIKYILKYIYVNKKNNDRETPLFNAIRNNNHEIIKLLYQAGAILDLNNKYNENTLELASNEMKDYLSDLMIKPKYCEYEKKYPLIIAIIKEDMDYINSHAFVNVRDNNGKTAKEFAKLIENEEILKLIK